MNFIVPNPHGTSTWSLVKWMSKINVTSVKYIQLFLSLNWYNLGPLDTKELSQIPQIQYHNWQLRKIPTSFNYILYTYLAGIWDQLLQCLHSLVYLIPPFLKSQLYKMNQWKTNSWFCYFTRSDTYIKLKLIRCSPFQIGCV